MYKHIGLLGHSTLCIPNCHVLLIWTRGSSLALGGTWTPSGSSWEGTMSGSSWGGNKKNVIQSKFYLSLITAGERGCRNDFVLWVLFHISSAQEL